MSNPMPKTVAGREAVNAALDGVTKGGGGGGSGGGSLSSATVS